MHRDFFTSDTHWGHHSMAVHRGYEGDTEAMDKDMIARWNAKVHPKDDVWHTGDFSFRNAAGTEAVLQQLHGRIHLIKGNHDTNLKASTLKMFASVQDYKLLRLQHLDPEGNAVKLKIVLSHYPHLTWDQAHYGALHFHGHSHGNCRYPHPTSRILDVGVDSVGLAPIDVTTALALMKAMGRTEYKAWDQHKEKTNV